MNYARSDGYKVTPVTCAAHRGAGPGPRAPRHAGDLVRPGRPRLRRRLRGAADRVRCRADRLRGLLRLHRQRRHASRACRTSPPRPATSGSPPPSSMWRCTCCSGWWRWWCSSSAWRCCCTVWRRSGVSKALRFLYYVPGALAGAASVMVWLFLLDPDGQPGRLPAACLRSPHLRPGHRPRPPARPVRPHRVLDRRGRLDRRHVRGAEQHLHRTSWRRPASTARVPGRPHGASRSPCCANGSSTW